MHDIDDYPDARPAPGLLVYRYDAPLCFANADDFRRRALTALEQVLERPRWFLLNIKIDSTAAEALSGLHAELHRRQVVLALAWVKHELAADLRAAGLLDALGPDKILMTLPTAVEAFHRWSAPRQRRRNP
jgi:MFS superfamily sulfate permease-like transporter